MRATLPSAPMVLLLGAMTAFSAVSIDLYLPGLTFIARDFDATPDAAARTVSVFFLGIAVGQLVYGPLSDRRGRRPTLLFGLALYVLASIACVFAGSMEQLILARLVQALGACSALVVSRGS